MTDIRIETNHVGFTVGNVDRAAAMFTGLFGYKVISLEGRNPKGVSLVMGIPGADIRVAHLRHTTLIALELIEFLGPDDRRPIDARVCDAGHAHLNYNVSDIEEMIRRAAKFSLIPIGRLLGSGNAGPNSGGRVAYLRDPDGIVIELIEPGGWSVAAG